MHKDRNGCELKVGDLVYLPCVITALHPEGDCCNLQMETVEPLIPKGCPSKVCMNARQVELVAPDNFDFASVVDDDEEAA